MLFKVKDVNFESAKAAFDWALTAHGDGGGLFDVRIQSAAAESVVELVGGRVQGAREDDVIGGGA